MPQYVDIANVISDRIQKGFYRPGEKLPSMREICTSFSVSLGTAQNAYHFLEENGLVIPIEKTGYFVRQGQLASGHLPNVQPVTQEPVDIKNWHSILELAASSPSDGVLQLGRGMPDVDSSSLKPLLKALSQTGRSTDKRALYYDDISGMKKLREQISRMLIDSGCDIAAEELIITSGCQEALSIAIRAVCEPGDIVAIESPAFHGAIQILQACGVRVLEVPTDPITGISIESLEMILEQWSVKLIQVTPNCNNPLGFIMPEERKRELLNLAKKYNVMILEDDIYGDLSYRYPRPLTIKSMDMDGRVLLCGSFSKTIAPGLRIGWIAPARFFDRVLYMKYTGTGSTSSAAQIAVASFIEDGYYLLHLRKMRAMYHRNLQQTVEWIGESFPTGIRMSQPQGGYILWVEFPKNFNANAFNKSLLQRKIQVVSGSIFSSSERHGHCIRINFGHKLALLENGIRTMGELLKNESFYGS
ncbi:putative HTH-type transcriptional regulator YjiR [Marinomonas spartinae]|uniref:Putative HTH-type transcriptional regulator YjiR n=1 Tax=Marinomonas spartinae TaxID=1792290 RepID=A0A1A8T7P2_9GAMM|nr:PLP-dependent aminotransferase family protein [Marinomonas spartinae]SBS27444.1 putative HTH-type transcriptional regulator YjiR [Marinomonas spartinae]SBS29806.1 putative HTH-type transcriptional regulator YjiR [Marinomonas spartinae]